MKNTSTQKLVGIALFTAIVVVLQLTGSFIRFGVFSISLVLVPIVVGAAVYGPKAGAWLGFVFGATVLLSGDAAPFLVVNPMGCVATVLIKGAASGLLAGLAYKAVANKNKYLGVTLSALVCPLTNSGLFFLGCRFFFMDTIAEWATAAGFTGNATLYVIVGLIGINFLFELLINMVLAPIILRLINIRKTN